MVTPAIALPERKAVPVAVVPPAVVGALKVTVGALV
jgi:hypothetical protein